MSSTPAFLKDGMYLPPAIRDFHDCKDAFKAMIPMLENYKKQPHARNLPDVSWVDAQCLTIDVVLWFFAMHGYTLQRIPKKRREALGCIELEKSIDEDREMRLSIMGAVIFGNSDKSRPNPNNGEKS